MKFSTAKFILHTIFDSFHCDSKYNLYFYGGEPLLAIRTINDLVVWIQKYYSNNNIDFGITTNGLLLNPTIVDYLINNNILITVSLDAPKQIHNKQRITVTKKGTFVNIMNNINYIRKYYYTYYRDILTFSSTYYSKEDINYALKYYDRKRIYRVDYNIAVNIDRQTIESMPDIWNMDSYYDAYIQAYYEGNTNRMYLYGRPFLKFCMTFDQRTIYPQEHSSGYPAGFCIPYQNHFFCMPDGSISFCKALKSMTLGRIENNDIIINRHRLNYLVEWLNDFRAKECNNCWAHRICRLCWLTILSDDMYINNEKIKHKCEKEKSRLIELIKIYIKAKIVDAHIFHKLKTERLINETKKTIGG